MKRLDAIALCLIACALDLLLAAGVCIAAGVYEIDVALFAAWFVGCLGVGMFITNPLRSK